MSGRSEPLTRERVLQAALEIVDGGGLEALSMRSLGRALGVEAMSLYNHVEGKDDLLDSLVDRVLAEIELPTPGEEWKEAMRRRAASARDAFGRHPWAIRLLESRSQQSSPRRLAYFDAVLGTLREAGFANALAMRAFSTLDAYIFGYILQQSGLAFQDDAELEEVGEDLLRQLADGYPHLASVTREVLGTGYDHDQEFAFGLELILEGLERRLVS